MSASPRLPALDADGPIARRFLIGAVQKAYLAFREGRLEMSPAAWLRLLRLHYQELTAQPAALSALPSPTPVLPAIPPPTSGDRSIDQIVLDEWLGSGGRLQFPESAHPLVSVLVVLHNRADLTLRCLRALRTTMLPLEIVVVDNHSTDDTPRLLDRLDGVVVVKNATNVGFLAAVNEGATHARGELLLLLNSDAEVLPGGLEAAAATLASSETTGAVVGKLVHMDGRLQEAGSIVWQDGSCQGYGRGDDPLDPAYMFRRPVDFGSGAFLLTRRLTFLAAGRFDDRFRPAYYEDADYCLRLWQSGRQVIYEPRAVVLHVESASSASSSDVVERLARHRKLFAAKHSAWLRSHAKPPGSNPLQARSRISGGRRLLFVEDCVPHEKLGAGYPRSRAMIQAALELGHQVTLYPRVEPSERWEEAYSDVPRDVELMLGHGHPGLSGFLTDRLSFYDALIVSRPHNMREVGRVLSALAPASRPAVLYDAEALFTLREVGRRRLAGLVTPTEEVSRVVSEETSLARGCDVILTVSLAEAARFAEAGFSNVEILGNSVVPNPTGRSFEARSGLLFAGSLVDDAGPNVDSVVWFVRQVLPLLREKLGPDLRLTVAGRHASPRLAALVGPSVVALGLVDDLRPHYDSHRIFVAPTRFGAGIPLKVHHAAAAGLPVVCTSLVQEQLHWQRDDDLLVADEAAQFAEQCCRLYRQPELWMHVRNSALRRVGRDCAPDRFRAILGRALEAACERDRPNARYDATRGVGP